MHLLIDFLQSDLSFFRFLVIEISFFVGGKGTAYKINLQYSFVGILNHDVFSMRVENKIIYSLTPSFCFFCKELIIFLSLFDGFVGGIFLLEN